MKAERSLATLLEEPDINSSSARKAAESLKKAGPGAIDPMIEALGNADKEQTPIIIDALSEQLSDKTFSFFAEGLSHTNQRCVSGVAGALAKNTNYNVKQLLDLLGEEGVSKPAVIDILRSKKSRLGMPQLLQKAYEVEPREKAALFKIIAEMAGEEHVTDLMSRLSGKDVAVRIHLMQVLAKFDRPDVANALEQQLIDTNKVVRKTALSALMHMGGDRNVKLLCSLLVDPDLEVQSKAVDLLVRMKHPDTMKYLVAVLKDENEYARRSAVEVLNEIADPSTIRHLLNAIEDDDWWVRSRASDALATIGGPKVMDAVLQLIRDQNENIRRSAIEILNQTKDERAVEHLIAATADEDWWVRERAADALGEIGDSRAVTALLRMLDGDSRSVPAALRAIGRLGNEKVLGKLVPLLDSGEKEIRVEAVNAVSKLASEGTAGTIKSKLQPLMTGSDETIARVAADAVVRIDNRFSNTMSEAAGARRSGQRTRQDHTGRRAADAPGGRGAGYARRTGHHQAQAGRCY